MGRTKHARKPLFFWFDIFQSVQKHTIYSLKPDPHWIRHTSWKIGHLRTYFFYFISVDLWNESDSRQTGWFGYAGSLKGLELHSDYASKMEVKFEYGLELSKMS